MKDRNCLYSLIPNCKQQHGRNCLSQLCALPGDVAIWHCQMATALAALHHTHKITCWQMQPESPTAEQDIHRLHSSHCNLRLGGACRREISRCCKAETTELLHGKACGVTPMYCVGICTCSCALSRACSVTPAQNHTSSTTRQSLAGHKP